MYRERESWKGVQAKVGMEKDERDLSIDSTGHDPARPDGLGYLECVGDRRFRGMYAPALCQAYEASVEAAG